MIKMVVVLKGLYNLYSDHSNNYIITTTVIF